eukprot:g1261.t1
MSDLQESLNAAETGGIQKIFEALASAPRRKILAYLSHSSLTAGEIADRFDMSKPSISQHLSVLEGAGLVRKEKRGQFVHYSIVQESLTNTLNSYVQEEQLDARYTVHRLYEADDPDAMLAEIGPRIRGIAMSFGKVDAALLSKLPNAEIVASLGVGYDHINTDDCLAANVMVTHTPDVLSDEVADTALGLLIMTVREFGQAEQWLRQGNWDAKGPYPLTKGTLRGRTLGIFGLGRIGKAIATRAGAFGMPIRYHGRRRQDGVSYPYDATLVELAQNCDTLMVVAPGGEETQHAVNAEVLAALGPEGIVINVGRGTVIDETARPAMPWASLSSTI